MVRVSEDDNISDAVLRFTAGRAWVDANGGTDAIRVMREADNGTCEFLETTYIGTDDQGNLIFEAISPDGFSAFAMVAVSAIPAPAPPPSGGGGTGTTVASSSEDIIAGVPAGFMVKEGPVRSAEITFKKDFSSVLITLNTGTTLPQGIDKKPDPEVYRYLTFDLYKASPDDVESVRIDFAVPLSQLSGKSVVLLHYDNGEWVRLPTEKTGEANGNALFSAVSPSMSTFAIVFEESAGMAPGEVVKEEMVVVEKTENQTTPPPTASPGCGIFITISALAALGFSVRRR
ncbi:MAG: PGF-pre-PGF domain-containing protein [Methanogenium sp.]|nr:PGF-pre-PGF domain-containing protein [Methanogenium sp.]